MRRIATADELFDILSSIKGGVKATIGYVTGAGLNLPEVKMRNPETNRMKGYHDYETFGREIGEEGEVGGVVKLTSYTLNWATPDSFNKAYGKYKTDFDILRQNFGLEPTQTREKNMSTQQYGDKGVTVYSGKNDDIRDHSYTRQNVHGALIKSVYYLINMEGKIVREMDKSELTNYFGPKRPVSGVAELQKMGTDEARIKEFISQHDMLKFRAQTFESKHILYIVATANGEPLLWVNEKLEHDVRDMKKVLNGVQVVPAEFMRIAKDRYQKDLQTITESANIKLTQADIQYIVEEATRRLMRL